MIRQFDPTRLSEEIRLESVRLNTALDLLLDYLLQLEMESAQTNQSTPEEDTLEIIEKVVENPPS